MKMSKKILVILVLVLAAFFRLKIYFINHPEYTYYKRKSEVEDAVKTVLETEETDGIQIPGISKIDYKYKKSNPVIVFQTFGFGIAPSSKEFGFYYSVNSVPVAYQGDSNPLKKNGDYWNWHSMFGSGHGETKHIESKWYTYMYGN